MVAAGLGIGVLPEGSVIPYSHSARFRVVELDEPWSLRPLQIATINIVSMSTPAWAL